MDVYEHFAAQLLPGPPGATFKGSGRTSGLAIWVAHLYGYEFSDLTRFGGKGTSLDYVISFTRDDGPEAQRRRAWMLNPAADPSYPPPSGGPSGGYAFHPAGWPAGAVLPAPPGEYLLGLEAMANQPRTSGLVPEPTNDVTGIAVVWIVVVIIDAFGISGYARGSLSLAVLIALLAVSIALGAGAHVGIKRSAQRNSERAERARAGWTGVGAGMPPGRRPVQAPPPPPDTISFPEHKPGER
jgi:hypothetical protein